MKISPLLVAVVAGGAAALYLASRARPAATANRPGFLDRAVTWGEAAYANGLEAIGVPKEGARVLLDAGPLGPVTIGQTGEAASPNTVARGLEQWWDEWMADWRRWRGTTATIPADLPVTDVTGTGRYSLWESYFLSAGWPIGQ